jgi:hypothetical protein
MNYQISPLQLSEFQHLINADDAVLAKEGVVRLTADVKPGYPCRVSLRDAEPGESVLLLNYEHQSVATPYRSRHAIIIRENAEQAEPFVNRVPEQLGIRILSVRGFDKVGMMIEADVVDGATLETAIEEMFGNAAVEYLHIHNAKPGCYAARVDRLN